MNLRYFVYVCIVEIINVLIMGYNVGDRVYWNNCYRVGSGVIVRVYTHRGNDAYEIRDDMDGGIISLYGFRLYKDKKELLKLL